MKYKIVKLHKADAFYGNRKDIIGAIVSVSEMFPEWTGKEKRGFRPAQVRIVSSPTDFFRKGEKTVFHAVKLEKQ